jgi:hypothetical protein
MHRQLFVMSRNTSSNVPALDMLELCLSLLNARIVNHGDELRKRESVGNLLGNPRLLRLSERERKTCFIYPLAHQRLIGLIQLMKFNRRGYGARFSSRKISVALSIILLRSVSHLAALEAP